MFTGAAGGVKGQRGGGFLLAGREGVQGGGEMEGVESEDGEDCGGLRFWGGTAELNCARLS